MKLPAVLLAVAILPASLFAVDGVVLVNQSTVIAAGGFPFVISQPGSYRLTGNLTVPTGADGIVISVPNITIDLNGFTIAGAPVTSSSAARTFGIQAPFGLGAITVRNGIISGFNAGFSLAGNLTMVEDMIILQAGTTFPFDEQLGVSGIIRHLTAPGKFVRYTCPMVVSESLASIFVQNTVFSTACTLHANSGQVL